MNKVLNIQLIRARVHTCWRVSVSFRAKGDRMNKVSSHLLLAALVCCGSGFAQQEKGDKEVGVGGQLLFTHTSNFIGNADFQLSFGYYASVRNYFGFEADPNITFEHTPGTPAVQGVALVNGKLV